MKRYVVLRSWVLVRDWLLAGDSPDPVQRALEPLVRVAMVIGVASSLVAVMLGYPFAQDAEQYARYAPRSVALQLVGLFAALWVLPRYGARPATRTFVAFVVLTLGVASVLLGVVIVSGSAVRLIVPIILIALALESREAFLWLSALLAAACLGMATPAFAALPPHATDTAVDRLIVTAIVMFSSLTILLAFRKALRDAIHDGALALKARQAERLAAHLESEVLHRRELVANLTAGVAHDLANVVQGMNINTAMLEPHVGAEEGRTALGDLKASAALASSLMRRLLAAGRTAPPVAVAVCPRSFLTRLDGVVPALLGRSRRYESEVRTERELFVDASRLEHVVLNLAMNARDAMPAGGTLAIQIEEGPRENTVALSVRDTGSGMSPEVSARAFEPFFTTKPDGSGTGLGLAFVARLVDELKGTIEIESALGRGTTVRVVLPAT